MPAATVTTTAPAISIPKAALIFILHRAFDRAPVGVAPTLCNPLAGHHADAGGMAQCENAGVSHLTH
jgi:hypothetical protein